MDELKKKVEALLFSSGKAMSVEELKKICGVQGDDILKKVLQDLKIDYDNRNSSLMLVNDNNNWKITTKEDYFHVVKKIVTETEMSKTLMETLAVIAWKYPIKQSELIKIRTNKAYDHLSELEQIGYISRQKHGRTKLIKLTDKFFSYFDLPPDKTKEKFSDFNEMAKSISDKEHEIKEMKEEHKKQVGEIKKEQDKHEEQQKEELEKVKKEIDLIDEKGNSIELEKYEPDPKTEIIGDNKPVLKTYDLENTEGETKNNEELSEKNHESEEEKEKESNEETEKSSEEDTEPEKEDLETKKPDEKSEEEQKKELEDTQTMPFDSEEVHEDPIMAQMDKDADKLIDDLMNKKESEEDEKSETLESKDNKLKDENSEENQTEKEIEKQEDNKNDVTP